MGGLRAQLSLALMGVACINLTVGKVSEKTILLLFLIGFLAQGSVPSVGAGWLCSVNRVPCTSAAGVLHLHGNGP